MKNQSCSKGLFFFSTRICNFLWEISSCLEFWMTANQKHLLLWWDAFVIFSSSVTLWVIWHKQTWRLRHGLSLFLFTCRISFVLNQTWQTLTKLIYKSCINNFIAKSKTTEISCINNFIAKSKVLQAWNVSRFDRGSKLITKQKIWTMNTRKVVRASKQWEENNYIRIFFWGTITYELGY